MRLIFEEEARFDCHSCGQCCRTDWKIPVEPSKADRLREIGPRFALVQESSGCWQLHRVEGECSFLNESNLCRVHDEMGPAHKPNACRLFPFVLTPTPEGVHVGASFYCPSVRARKGRPLREHRQFLLALLEQMPEFDRPQDVTTFSAEQPLGWNAYQLLEDALRRRLACSEQAILELLQGLSDHLQDWWRQEVDALFQSPRPEIVARVERLQDWLAGELVLDLGSAQESTWGKRYASSLIQRKFLRRGAFLEELLHLAAVQGVVSAAGNPERAVEVLELNLTHTASFRFPEV